MIDSSVVAKWILPEADSSKAQNILTQAAANGDSLIVLDLVFPEVTNVIWKRFRQQSIGIEEARKLLHVLADMPVRVEAAIDLLAPALEIATKYDRAVYDALFVALAQRLGCSAVTADEPLYNTTHGDFPQIKLLRLL